MSYKLTCVRGPSLLVLAAACAGLALAGCKQNESTAAAAEPPPPLAALPPTTGAAPPLAPAPTAAQLAPAAPARVGRLADPRQGYAFADRAYAMGRAFGEAPPDYAFDDNGV